MTDFALNEHVCCFAVEKFNFMLPTNPEPVVVVASACGLYLIAEKRIFTKLVLSATLSI